MIDFSPCPKAYSTDQDKAATPEQTLARVRQRLDGLSLSILAHTRRIDNGRLGIPVFLSVCGEDAKDIMPTRKQMGKGASPAQAEASALMELMERYGFFTYWEHADHVYATWSEAECRFGAELMPLSEIIAACHDRIGPDTARRVLDTRRWRFARAWRIPVAAGDHSRPTPVMVPLDLFKQLGEFNGSSAGNTDVESIFQGACELVERHVCCLADEERPELPTISPEGLHDPTLRALAERFAVNGIRVTLKDLSMGMPVPTVGALAWDPSTFPGRSEIVFTAGTAASPAKAAIRALTEVAQLAGDFNSNACYEASGLPKYRSPDEAAWLLKGPLIRLEDLPTVEARDIRDELCALAKGLEDAGFALYAVSTTNRDTRVPSHYSFAPGLRFRERDKNASLGLFTGRLISEEADLKEAEKAFAVLETVYPGAHFLPFFRGMVALRGGDPQAARHFFAMAEPLQPGNDAQALAAFYHAYAHTLAGEWEAALPGLLRAASLCPDMKEYLNLLGVSLFKLGRYEEAGTYFLDIVTRLDKGSAVDLQNLGLCRKFAGDRQEAVRYLTAALGIDPELVAARNHLDQIFSDTPHSA